MAEEDVADWVLGSWEAVWLSSPPRWRQTSSSPVSLSEEVWRQTERLRESGTESTLDMTRFCRERDVDLMYQSTVFKVTHSFLLTAVLPQYLKEYRHVLH